MLVWKIFFGSSECCRLQVDVFFVLLRRRIVVDDRQGFVCISRSVLLSVDIIMSSPSPSCEEETVVIDAAEPVHETATLFSETVDDVATSMSSALAENAIIPTNFWEF